MQQWQLKMPIRQSIGGHPAHPGVLVSEEKGIGRESQLLVAQISAIRPRNTCHFMLLLSRFFVGVDGVGLTFQT